MEQDGLIELTESECLDLLGTDVVGRLAYVTPLGPVVVPVNYGVATRDDVPYAIDFRTGPQSEIAAFALGEQVAFEIDHLDHDRERGWSVLAQGRCERVEEYAVASDSDPASDPQPWAGGHRPLLLRLEWVALTGRRVGGSYWPHPVVSGGRRSY